jgi:hypothetical protein
MLRQLLFLLTAGAVQVATSLKLNMPPLSDVPHIDSSQNTERTMHTFFEPIHPETTEDVLQMGAWSEVWGRAGWHTRMLTVSDARLHPLFDVVDQRLNKLLAAGAMGRNNGAYEKMCYLRYLAIAASGGGWMCDYDVIPLGGFVAGEPLPANFTSYNAHVPDLMVGTADQWTELLLHMLAAAEDVVYNHNNDASQIGGCGVSCGPYPWFWLV